MLCSAICPTSPPSCPWTQTLVMSNVQIQLEVSWTASWLQIRTLAASCGLQLPKMLSGHTVGAVLLKILMPWPFANPAMPSTSNSVYISRLYQSDESYEAIYRKMRTDDPIDNLLPPWHVSSCTQNGFEAVSSTWRSGTAALLPAATGRHHQWP